MILQPKSSPSRRDVPAVLSTAPKATVPAWLRHAVADAQNLVSKEVEDVAVTVGAAIGALDAVVRRQERWTGAWRQRLALTAAAVTAKQAGRVEDESALRDAVLLTKPGDDVGPAGRMLLAWRWLAARPVGDLLSEKTLAAMLEEFGHVFDDETVHDLAGELRQLSTNCGTVGLLNGAFMAAERRSYGRAVGAWLADTLLAQRLGWMYAVPLLGTEARLGMNPDRPGRSVTPTLAASIEAESDRIKGLLAGQARTVLRAIDLSAEFERRADRLLAVTPRLRAKAAGAVVERLLSDDAMIASEKITGISDRGLRRLFDRLVNLSAVRELSGRPTFRIYGL